MKLIDLFKAIWRKVKWAIKSLWLGYPAPKILPGRRYARSYLRKLYKPILQDLDRSFNATHDRALLWTRKLTVTQRRHERLPEATA